MKKAAFAVLLAGSMTVGMAPAAAFAAEDTGAVTEAEATTADENTETPDDGQLWMTSPRVKPTPRQLNKPGGGSGGSQAEAEAQAAAGPRRGRAQAASLGSGGSRGSGSKLQAQAEERSKAANFCGRCNCYYCGGTSGGD